MVTLEELKQKYPVQQFSLYGECVVVPGNEFDPDWEHYLTEQGHKCHFVDFEGKAVSLIELGRRERKGETREVFRPRTSEKKETLAERRTRILHDPLSKWTPKDREKLITLWNDPMKITIREIAEHFPKRSVHAIKNRLQKLREAAHIESRYDKGKEKGSKKASRKRSKKDISPPVHASADTPVHKPVHTRIPTALPPLTPIEPTEPQLIKLLQEIRDQLKPKEDLIWFESYCRGCRDIRSVEDENVWKCCPVCGGQLIIWNVNGSP